ncbi:hypothetical protein EJD97_024123 [Solanum chilense]|uniref:Uncharacterized protein n=1 Tax=Solanum chilense TaxID=4083 RepID=A0A6N2AEM3_SOLCI|nr:hypothetical protein EJD97_024123 [Solanum chilense]
MRETPTNSTIYLDQNNPNSFWQWKSPLPYLFGGLALTMALIIVAIILLVFSFYQPCSGDDEEEDKSASRGNNSTSMAEMSPRIIVIMAGERKPTHIGVPIPD